MTEREAYDIGQAHMYLVKSAGDAVTTHALAGELYLSDSGWVMLRVPNGLVRASFDALHELGAELPLKDGKLNAHITVIRPEELEQIGGADKLTERGHTFHYNLGPIQVVEPQGWDDVSKCWYIRVHSPELEQLRKSYGLTARPNNNEHAFHITIAKRRKNVLRANEVSKAADLLPGGLGDDKPDNVFAAAALTTGKKHEKEHTTNSAIAKEIAKDHLTEDPKYYQKLEKVEKDAYGRYSSGTAESAEKSSAPKKHPKTIAVDLDGTLASYDGWQGEAHFGELRPGAREALQRFKEKGYLVIIYTCRGNKKAVREWLEKNDVHFDHINENPHQPPGVSKNKMSADVYIDDKAISANHRWSTIEKRTHEAMKTAADVDGAVAYLSKFYGEQP